MDFRLDFLSYFCVMRRVMPLGDELCAECQKSSDQLGPKTAVLFAFSRVKFMELDICISTCEDLKPVTSRWFPEFALFFADRLLNSCHSKAFQDVNTSQSFSPSCIPGWA